VTVRLTDHARKVMAEREIEEADELRVAAAPDKVEAGNRPGRDVRHGFAMVGAPPFRALLRVVLDLTTVPTSVVTVYATTLFRRYGAGP
jgi:hypothetical protein